MKIWFIGGGEFAASCLTCLADMSASLKNAFLKFEKIVTGEPTKAGRGLKESVPAAERAAAELGLPVERTGKLSQNEALKAEMLSNPPDLIFVVDFGQLIGEPFLNGPRHGCLNIHPSLLPRWRGAAPVQRAILNGDAATGVTVFRLVREMDAGPILFQREIPIPIDADSTELFKTLALAGSQIAVQSVESIIEGNCQFSDQNSEFVTYAAKLEKEEARLSWNRGGLAVHNTVRAFASSYGAYAAVSGKRLKVWRTAPVFDAEQSEAEQLKEALINCRGVPPHSPLKGQSPLRIPFNQRGLKKNPGTVLCLSGGDPVVACGDGAVRLAEVQAEGKRRTSGAEWFRGTRLKEGDVLTE